VRFWIPKLLFLGGMLAVAGCASVYNYPGNQPLPSAAAVIDAGRLDPAIHDDDVLVALSFSGGGTRAAAFSFGVLQELDRVRSGSSAAKSLLDRVGFVSGVSGGAITAAYFGLKKREALRDFRDKFLLRNTKGVRL
jgi:NTE family protein